MKDKLKYLFSSVITAILIAQTVLMVNINQNLNKVNEQLSNLEQRINVTEKPTDTVIQTSNFKTTDYFTQRSLGIVTNEYLLNFHTITEEKPFVIMFYQEGCYYCEIAEQNLESRLNEGALPIDFYFVDTQINNLRGETTLQSGDEVNEFNFYVNATPSFLVYDGETYRIYIGANQLDTIIEMLGE